MRNDVCSVVYDPELADASMAADAASAIRGAGGGRVDLLVNAAGMLHDSSTGNMPEKALRLVRRSFVEHFTASQLAMQTLTIRG
eukprot:COSAG02_NODE_422_length_22587_cov_10.209089_11_plen_84_part_00